MGREDARFVFAKSKRQAMKEFVCSIPDVTIWPNIERRTKLLGILLARGAVDPICCDQQIATRA